MENLEEKIEELIEEIESPYLDDEVDTDDEWGSTILAAMEESEQTGIPFDHIMGKILGGIHDDFNY